MNTQTPTPKTAGETFAQAKKVIGKVTPVPTDFDAVSSPSDLKNRLDWGEPALSILDVRDRTAFNHERITGAMPMPMADLIERSQSAFEPNRDIFIYSDSDSKATEAANQLRSNGFERVTTIQGGMAAWKAIGGATEGQIYKPSPIPGFN